MGWAAFIWVGLSFWGFVDGKICLLWSDRLLMFSTSFFCIVSWLGCFSCHTALDMDVISDYDLIVARSVLLVDEVVAT